MKLKTKKLKARQKAYDDAPGTEYGDGKRKWFTTTGTGKNVCYRRPGSNKK